MLSLISLCLSLIAEKFERFHLAIAVSKDANLKRNLEFLQKVYSSELASELFEREILKDEHLEFLISEHLKFFNENWLVNSRYKTPMKDILCRLPNLTKISCIESNDEILENIAKFCPKIVEIYSQHSSVTDRGVNYLCKKENGKVSCPELKNLLIYAHNVSDIAVENLIRNLETLENLTHERVPSVLYSMHKDDLPRFEKMPSYNLVELIICDEESLPYYNELLKICLTVCPKLKSLSCSISDKEQLNFFSNPCLEDVSISSHELGPKINIDRFLKNCGRNLIKFSANNCIMSISELAASCPKLKWLTISNVTFPDVPDDSELGFHSSVTGCRKLKCLSINDVPDDHGDSEAVFPDDHGDSEAVFHSLVSCTFLERDNILSDKAMGLFLLSPPNLEEVNFFYCDLSPDRKTYILKYCQKHILKSISFTQCMNLEVSFVKSILSGCPSLKTMLIDGCSFIEEEELVELAESLPNKPEIEVYDP